MRRHGRGRASPSAWSARGGRRRHGSPRCRRPGHATGGRPGRRNRAWLARSRSAGGGVSGLLEHPGGVQNPAVAVELVLASCAVAHSYRCAVVVAGSAVQVALSRHVAAIDGEQHRQTRSLQAACVQQPPEEPAGLVELADPEECGNADAGVPGPRRSGSPSCVCCQDIPATTWWARRPVLPRASRSAAARSAGSGLRRHGREGCRRSARSTPASGPRPGRSGPRQRRDRRG